MPQWTKSAVATTWTHDPRDRERQSAWILLGSLDDRVARAFEGKRAPKYLNRDKLFEIGWSETEELIARAGASLYSGPVKVDLGRMVRRLNQGQMERVIHALRVRRGEEDP